jgi:Transglycosylase-like domain
VAVSGDFVVSRVAGPTEASDAAVGATRDFPGRPEGPDTPMQTKTALAVAGSVLAVPGVALARREARLERRAGSTASATLQAIAACESGGTPSTNTGNGFYGKYQFTQETWQSVGGTGNPAAASEAVQDRRAAALYAQSGGSPWPVCGQ